MSARGVRLEVAADLPVVRGDRARLLQVFQNLLDNAAKFMGDEPHPLVRIETHRRGEGEALVVVRDNGIGVDPLYHAKVFELFTRLNPQVEGTGVGLALVRRIIEAHGGRVWLESAGHSEGTAVWLSLPTVPETVPGS